MKVNKKEESETQYARRMAYIRNTGYGPTSMFTLQEWLNARAYFAANRTKCIAASGV